MVALEIVLETATKMQMIDISRWWWVVFQINSDCSLMVYQDLFDYYIAIFNFFA